MKSRCWKNRLMPVYLMALAVAVAGVGSAWGQGVPASGPAVMTVAPGGAGSPTSVPSMAPAAATTSGAVAAPAAVPVVPATLPSLTVPATMAAASAPAELPAVTQPFIATVTADRVYVRSGPATGNYEVGQLTKGDLVYVVGALKGWYQILPPNGSYCLIAKEFVELDPGNTSGTVKGDYINVRAGTAIYKTRDSSVLTVVRKGTKLKVLGMQDAYYQIAPPEKAYLFISPQFVKQSADVAYKVPDLKLAAGITGPTGVTVEAPTTPPAAASAPSVTLVIPPTEPGPGVTTPLIPPADTTPATKVAVVTPTETVPPAPLPPLVPAVKFSETATARFNDVNSRYQAEAKKQIGEQNLGGLLQEFKEILAMENVSPSVKTGTEADIAAIDRIMTVQRLVKEQTAAQAMTKKQTDALQEQYDAAQRAIAAARQAGPYSAEGMLQSSTIVQGKYALVNPQTGRVVAYVDPASASIDMSLFVGKYIGVRGITKKMENSDISVIQVSNATLMPTPESGK